MTDTIEEWRDIPGHIGYQASSLGRIRCNSGMGARKIPSDNWRILKPWADSKRRITIATSHAGVVKKHRVHVLVLEAFVGTRPPGMVACHYDGDCTNNAIDNLRWDTPSGNIGDDIRIGKRSGERCPTAKITYKDAEKIRELFGLGMSRIKIGEMFGITHATVWAITVGKTWTRNPEDDNA